MQLDTHQVLADPIQKTQSQPLLLCDCSALFSRGSTQRADQRGSQGIECREVRTTKSHRKPSSFTRQLQVVELPETVVSLLHGAFRCCRALRAAIAPGCQHFGPKAFEECCSLTQMGVTQCPDNILAPQAQLRPRVFQGCTALQHLNLGQKGQGSTI